MSTSKDIAKSMKAVDFQLDNVRGWISCFQYEAAAIKASCLLEKVKELQTVLDAAILKKNKTEATEKASKKGEG